MAGSGRRRAVPGRARPIRDAGAPMSRAASSRLASKQLMTAIIALPGVKGGAKHCHRGRRGEMVRGGRDEAGGGVSRKRREGVARAQFPAGGDPQVRSSSPCFARGCG